MKDLFKICMILILDILIGAHSFGQKEPGSIRLGINYGIGKQKIFPYNNPDYTYNLRVYKFQINYPVRKSRVFTYELQLEPALGSARHQLLNEFFIQPKDGADYLEQREILTKEKTITEYVLNIGFIARYNIKERFSLFLYTSVGPMFTDTHTERLARGFAFADIVAIGLSYKVKKTVFELRPGLRHVSNANLRYPNSGHNSSIIDFGISVFL